LPDDDAILKATAAVEGQSDKSNDSIMDSDDGEPVFDHLN
jgi:hypothetical protein